MTARLTQRHWSAVSMLGLAAGALAFVWGMRPNQADPLPRIAEPKRSVGAQAAADELNSWRARYPMLEPESDGPKRTAVDAAAKISPGTAQVPGSLASHSPQEPLSIEKAPLLSRMWDLPPTRPVGPARQGALTPPDWRIVGTVQRGEATMALLMLDGEPGVREVKVGARLPGGAELRWVSQGTLGLVLPDGRAAKLDPAGGKPVARTESDRSAVPSPQPMARNRQSP